uniref:Uncharacterized protein n=1 Tax=Romanomermis culicivorax TaxID=13658 RepID=A0A915J2B6_ROMCU
MICLHGNTLVAQGIMSWGQRTNPEYKEAWYTNIVSHIPWIMEVYDDIKKDFSQDEVRYKIDLSRFSDFVTTLNDGGITMQNLEYFCEGLGLDPTKQLGNKLDLQLNETKLEETFFIQGFDSETTFGAMIFPFYNIIGYVDISSLYACISLCHQLNGDQVCNFVAPAKRCYLAHGKFVDRWGSQISIPRVMFPCNHGTFH